MEPPTLKLPRPEAEELAERLYADLRPRFVELMTEMLAEPEPDGLTPYDLARIERVVANIRRKELGLPPLKRVPRPPRTVKRKPVTEP